MTSSSSPLPNLRSEVLLITDIDGTIAENGKVVTPEMRAWLQELRKHITVAVVGGSALHRIYDKLGQSVLTDYDYVFPENGLVAYKDGELIARRSIVDAIGNEALNKILAFCLRYIADLDLPLKRGTFIDFRTGLINISPAGRFLTPDDRRVWVEYDERHRVRLTFAEKVRELIAPYDMDVVVGGQMGFDIFPRGWDKTQALEHVRGAGFKTIHFCGDKTEFPGNDYTMYTSKETVGHKIEHGPAQVREIFDALFLQRGTGETSATTTTTTTTTPAAAAADDSKADDEKKQ